MLKSPLSVCITLLLALPGSVLDPAGTARAEALAGPVLPGGFHLKEFPRRSLYLDAIRREASSHGLPHAIADAVVRIESGYDPSAVGAVGEIGLMQVRPTTAAMLGFKGTNAELAHPETNIRYGVAYLAKAWRLAGGDLCRALMKYRAGHGAETMSPLSAEYCRRARVHLTAIGWSPDDGAGSPTDLKKALAQPTGASLKEAAVARGAKIISVRSSDALLAANRARIAAVWNRISVTAKR